ncbi:MAG: DNA mismatch repair protein [Deltaproteobacteria bacterium]|nr:DNA mismatch repair protein [Deltaproteobacteria bacterium]MBN2671547.1 DNA mismatch repair protein [Deltaproteobacteria bacterium]
MKQIPDLLNHDPVIPPKLLSYQKGLGYAFATGDSAGALRHLLDDAPVAESSFDAENFAGDLFVDEMIRKCFQIQLKKWTSSSNIHYFKRLLCHPPKAHESTLFRQDIQRELLENEPYQKEFRRLYRAMVELRDEFDSQGVMGPMFFTRRRIDILTDVKDVIDLAAAGFKGASSGLSRISGWAKELQQTDGFSKLFDFLNYENNLATVKLEIGVAADGSVRRFKVLELSENRKNRFHQHPVKRFFVKLAMLLRGYRVSSEGLVARWVEDVFETLAPDFAYFIGLIGDMEFHLAGLHFSDLARKHGHRTCLPTFIDKNSKSGRCIEQLFNPLLLEEDSPAVPCHLCARRQDAIVIITGPNSGGKTRLLQAIALSQLMGQTGLPVPAASAQIHEVTGLFVTLLDWSKADQKEGRLGTELLRIKSVFEKATAGSLVVLDELCSGTNPQEGEEIFHLVISLLREWTFESFISTHFLRFAQQLEQEDKQLDLEFLQVELDDAHVPTYQFIPGVADTSLATHTAKRLGITRDELLRLIQRKE